MINESAPSPISVPSDCFSVECRIGRSQEINSPLIQFAPRRTSEARFGRRLLLPRFFGGILWCMERVSLVVPPHSRALGIAQITGDSARAGHPRRTRRAV